MQAPKVLEHADASDHQKELHKHKNQNIRKYHWGQILMFKA